MNNKDILNEKLNIWVQWSSSKRKTPFMDASAISDVGTLLHNFPVLCLIFRGFGRSDQSKHVTDFRSVWSFADNEKVETFIAILCSSSPKCVIDQAIWQQFPTEDL